MQIKPAHKEKALEYAQKMGDIRFAGQVAFVVLVLLISWSGIKTIETNYKLQKEITALQQQNDLQKLANENMRLQNDYYNSNQYLELAARQNLGLASAGEKEIIVPKRVALANSIDVPKVQKKDLTEPKKPAYQRNFESWVDFFLHRQDNAN
jgi:cell division protein FtsB